MVGSMDTTACIRVACGLLLLITCFQRASPYSAVVLKKRQAEVVKDLANVFETNPKGLAEEAFSLEFSGEDYNTLVNLLLDAKNEFVKLQVNPNNPSYNRAEPLNGTNLENATVTEESVDTNTEDETPESEPFLKSAIADDMYFNPVTPDPGFADPIIMPANLLAQLETVRDRKAKTQKLKAQLAQGSGQVDNGVGVTDAAIPQDLVNVDVQEAAPEDVFKTAVTPCIPPPQYLPVSYPVAVDPASAYLYQPQYFPYPLPDGYVYPQEAYAPVYNYPVTPQGRAEVPPGMSHPDGSFTSGDCLSYFCSRTVCTEWECTSDPCTSGQCVAKQCVEWSCDAWRDAPLTKVQDVDWPMPPDETRYFDPLAGR